MLPDVKYLFKNKNILYFNTVVRLVAFRSRGVYVWYNVWYKCKIRGGHSAAEGHASGATSGSNATGFAYI